MKKCPVCQQTYSDNETNFCLNDGAALVAIRDDPPPTVLMNQARTTNQNWSDYETAAHRQNGQMTNNQPFGVQNQQFAMPAQNQTLAIVSLTLGILGLVLFCCWGGIPLGAGAVVTGYLAYNNAKRDPINYAGSGMAIGGIAAGAISLLLGLGILLIAIFSK